MNWTQVLPKSSGLAAIRVHSRGAARFLGPRHLSSLDRNRLRGHVRAFPLQHGDASRPFRLDHGAHRSAVRDFRQETQNTRWPAQRSYDDGHFAHYVYGTLVFGILRAEYRDRAWNGVGNRWRRRHRVHDCHMERNLWQPQPISRRCLLFAFYRSRSAHHLCI